MTTRIPLLLLALLIGNAAVAQAATLTTTWTNPSQRTDGTAFASTSISGTTVEWGTCSGTAFGTSLGIFTTVGAVITHTTPTVPPGVYCVHAKTNATDGTMSAWSNVASKTILAAPPNPPVIVTVTQTAYEMHKRWFWYRMVAVGTVPLGEVCGQPLNEDPLYATLDNDQVALNSRYKGGQVFGRCA